MENTNTGAEKFRWDLSIMYGGLDDPQLDADIDALSGMMKDFNTVHKNNLTYTLGQAVKDFSEIDMLQNKIFLYLYLVQSVNVSDPVVKAKMADARTKISMVAGEYLAFFEIELAGIGDEVLAKLYENDPVVARHKPWIEHIRIFKPHLLSEPVEAALSKRSPFGPSAWGEFFDELESDLRFEFNGNKLTLTDMTHIISESKDSDERFRAMTVLNKGFEGPFAKYSAQTLYMVAGFKGVEEKERSYRHPMESANLSNRIPDSVVDMLHRVVNDVAGPITKRYYRIKAAHLGLKTLRWSDRNAQMPFSDSSVVPFDEAIKIVLAAYETFSPALAGLIRESITSKRIDAPGIEGRRGGAYNYSVVLPGNKPVSFTFLNYKGSGRDVMTLAHELGHGVHGLLGGQAQGPLMFHAPIAYCELASTFGEMTTYNFLKKKLLENGDIRSLLALTMSKIDESMNTSVRQIGFSNFERRLHGMDSSYTKWSNPKKLSVEDLNQLWLETLTPLYGQEGEVFTYQNAEYLWSYIPHFHNPFYVYGYPFGEFCTQSLYAQQSRLGDKFEPLYLDALRSGGTKNVVELLKPFGLDPTDDNFWAQGIQISLGAMVKEAEELSRKMGVSID